ncbi:hypothetical protein CFY87_08280 [Actinobacillus seminis]|uniref:Opacity protein and related surface antigens n=1 Tax=Actinobacillus seminis TaxID=722 RepID=A0A263HAJ0_9PAST|nr:outer membrane beta-barrel protein [Actinobacillus seminis]OZN24460.1 hypothetical protein CFY87_08280 [Actinobacillus seminis]SUU38394.1 Opacity protein and related surface antigens [Actinobacillus seminis]
MKRLLTYLSLSALFSTSAIAAEKSAFTGFYFGGELSSVKQEFSVPYSELGYVQEGKFIANGSRGTRFGVVTGYGFDMGGNFVGLGEAGISVSNVKTKVTKEQFATSLAYLQGYRIANKVLPYVKVSVNASSFDINNEAIPSHYAVIENSGAFGFGIGGGIRANLSDNFDVGIEYNQYTLKGKDDIKIKTKSVALTAVYHF